MEAGQDLSCPKTVRNVGLAWNYVDLDAPGRNGQMLTLLSFERPPGSRRYLGWASAARVHLENSIVATMVFFMIKR
jgi:hypothetical protein